MLLRLRWLTLGMVLALFGSALVVTRLVRMRQRLGVENVRRVAAAAGADGLEWAAQRLRGHRALQGTESPQS